MTLKAVALEIADVVLITPDRHRDARGIFSEVYSKSALAKLGIDLDFQQDNYSLSAAAGTVRGLHFQSKPAAQAKLVRVARGAILDVAVDLRRASATFGRHVAQRLSADAWTQLLIPEGFAHGFVTLEPDTEVLYKVTHPYSPAHDRGLRWDDPALKIAWGIGRDAAILSDKDKAWPSLRELDHDF